MGAGEHRALANEFEVTPGQQGIAGAPVLRDEERVAGKLRLEALIDRVGTHALGGRLVYVVAGQLMLVVGPDLEDAGAVDVGGGNYGSTQETDLVLVALHMRMRVESQASDRLSFHVLRSNTHLFTAFFGYSGQF